MSQNTWTQAVEIWAKQCLENWHIVVEANPTVKTMRVVGVDRKGVERSVAWLVDYDPYERADGPLCDGRLGVATAMHADLIGRAVDRLRILAYVADYLESILLSGKGEHREGWVVWSRVVGSITRLQDVVDRAGAVGRIPPPPADSSEGPRDGKA